MHALFAGNALFALVAALLWGGGDFSGGMGVKQSGGGLSAALRLILLSHATSCSVLVAIALFRGDRFPHGALLAWGLAAGLLVGSALAAFYLALSRGTMGTSAAISGLLAAAIPAALTLYLQGSPGLAKLLGFAIAGLAIWLIATGPSPTAIPNRGAAWLASSAGAGFGIYFIALKMASPARLLWPMVTTRIGSLALCSLLLLIVRRARPADPLPPLTRRTLAWVFSTALLDTSGNLLFLAATRAGRLDIASVLASLYPASTILLAAIVLGERPTGRQALGLATALAAVLLIAT